MEVKALSGAALLRLPAEDRATAADPEATLVAAAQRDPAAFLALYDRYFPRIHGYMRVRLRDAAACEDLTSQVFTTALARLATFRHDGGGREGSNFGAWLFRIAQRAVQDTYRGRQTERLAEETLHALPDGSPGPEEQALAAERERRLRAVVGALPAERQHLLALRYGAGLAYDEIGRVVGKSPAAVRVAVHRTLVDLRRRYPHDD
jgi:RNA polymerase sigma-70 factor (ECF subfamily)